MFLQAFAERGLAEGGRRPAEILGTFTQWLDQELDSLVTIAGRNPGTTALVVAVLVALMLAHVLSSR